MEPSCSQYQNTQNETSSSVSPRHSETPTCSRYILAQSPLSQKNAHYYSRKYLKLFKNCSDNRPIAKKKLYIHLSAGRTNGKFNQCLNSLWLVSVLTVLLQAPCQVELDNWVNSIHSACAAAFARHRGKTGTLHLLQVEMMRYETGLGDNKKIVRNVGSPLSDWSSCYQAESRDDLVLMGHFVLQLTPL